MEANIALGLVAVGQADPVAAEEQYAAIEPVRAMFPVPDTCFVSLDRLLGSLALTMDRPDQAITHFEEGIGFCRKCGYRPEMVWSLCGLAEALLLRGAPDDVVAADQALVEAMDAAQELGMRPVVERAQALQQEVASRAESAPRYPDSLTEREVEVLRLLSGGKTNREIAEGLFISVRTASNHVSNIFVKINAANRAEAATYANRQGLV